MPSSISIPFLHICNHLELPPVATYAGVCLWNFKPIFPNQPIDDLDNIFTLLTFTGSIDESWFYLVSVAIEARGAPLLPLMLEAVQAARIGDAKFVTEALIVFAQRIDELGSLLTRMYENCDPHVFYHRIRPFLAGSKNMAEAGLPRGVIFEEDTGVESYRQYGGGSNAQSSLIQFFDLILGVQHRPTGETQNGEGAQGGADTTAQAPPSHNFIHEMRSYMPGPHRRFLEHVASVANIRPFVEQHRRNQALTISYDACLAMLRALRDKHIQLVSRYIIVKSHEQRHATQPLSPTTTNATLSKPLNLAGASSPPHSQRPDSVSTPTPASPLKPAKKSLRGTGGTALIPFLKQARDETGEPAIDAWAKRILGHASGEADEALTHKKKSPKKNTWEYRAAADKAASSQAKVVPVVGLAGTWSMDDGCEGLGGLCHW